MTNFNADSLAAREIDALREAVRLLAFRVRYLEALSAGVRLCDDIPEPVVPLGVGSAGTSILGARCDHTHPGFFQAEPGNSIGAMIESLYELNPAGTEEADVESSYEVTVT